MDEKKTLDLFNSVFDKNVSREDLEQLVRQDKASMEFIMLKSSIYALMDILIDKFNIPQETMLGFIQKKADALVNQSVDETIDNLNSKAMAQLMNEDVPPDSVC